MIWIMLEHFAKVVDEFSNNPIFFPIPLTDDDTNSKNNFKIISQFPSQRIIASKAYEKHEIQDCRYKYNLFTGCFFRSFKILWNGKFAFVELSSNDMKPILI